MRRTTALGAVLTTALTALVLIAARPALAADGWLGVSTQSLDSELRDALDVRGDGVLITRVVEGSPADRGGLRKGDVLVAIDSRSIGSPDELRSFVREAGDGRSVAVRVLRDGSSRTIEVRLGSADDDDARIAPRAPMAPRAPRAAPAPMPAPEVRGKRHIEVWKDGKRVDPEDVEELKELEGLEGLHGLKGLERLKDLHDMVGPKRFEVWTPDGSGQGLVLRGSGRGRLGVQVQDVSDDLADALSLDGDRGALVTQVLDDTPASRAGVRAGDVILSVDGRQVDDADDLRQELGRSEGTTRLEVSRRGTRRTLEAELGRGDDSGQRFEWKSGDDEDRMRARVFRMAPEARRELRRELGSRGSDDRDAMRREIDELRRELRQLREELRENDDR